MEALPRLADFSAAELAGLAWCSRPRPRPLRGLTPASLAWPGPYRSPEPPACCPLVPSPQALALAPT